MGLGISDVVPKAAGLLDFVLNIVGLLLWFNWRAGGLKVSTPGTLSLAATLKSTEVIEPQRWFSFFCLVLLLLIRPLVYFQIGSKVNWIATVDLTAIVLPFRSDLLGRIYFYSTLSFGLALAIVYASLLLLSVINAKSATTDYFCRLVMLQLGWLSKLHWSLRLLLAPLAAALIWVGLSKILVSMGVAPAPKNTGHAWQVAGLMALCLMVAWKYVAGLFLGLHLLNSYVYLGTSSFWQFVALTGDRLASPLRWLPLRIGRVDLGPAFILVGLLVGAHFAGVALGQLYRLLPL